MTLPLIPQEDKHFSITSGRIELRQFSETDSNDLFNIRNHASVRAGMLNNQPIDRGRHEAFVNDNLLFKPKQWLFIARRSGEAFGLALLRDLTAPEVEIGVMLVDAERRRKEAYFVSHMIAWFGFEKLNLTSVISKVPRTNKVALDFNLKCGFTDTGVVDEHYYHLRLLRSDSHENKTHMDFRQRWPLSLEFVDS